MDHPSPVEHLPDDRDPALVPLQQPGQLGDGRRSPEPGPEQPSGGLKEPAGGNEGLVVALGLRGLGQDVITAAIARRKRERNCGDGPAKCSMAEIRPTVPSWNRSPKGTPRARRSWAASRTRSRLCSIKRLSAASRSRP